MTFLSALFYIAFIALMNLVFNWKYVWYLKFIWSMIFLLLLCWKKNFDFRHLTNFLLPCLALEAILFGECCLRMNYWLWLKLPLWNFLEKTDYFMMIIFVALRMKCSFFGSECFCKFREMLKNAIFFCCLRVK